MRKENKKKNDGREFSYREYVKAFFPNNSEIPRPFDQPKSLPQDPKLIGAKLAAKSLELATRELHGAVVEAASNRRN